MVLACAGHWYLSVLYLAPVAVIVGFLKVLAVRDRRAEARELQEASAAIG